MFSPRCCEKIIFYPKEYFIPLFFTLSLCISFSTVQRCADCNAVRRTRTRRNVQNNHNPSIVSYSLRPEKKFSMLFSKKKFFSTPTGIRTHTKKSWFPPQRAPSARRRRRRRRRCCCCCCCCCPQTPPSHRIGIGKKRGVSNLGIDKNPIGIKPLYEPQPFEPAIPISPTTGQRFPTLARGLF